MNCKVKHVAKSWGRALGRGFLALMLFPAAGAMAQTYVGKFCFSSTVTERETGPVSPPETFAIVSQYDVTHLGGNAYALVGSLAIPDQPFVTTGLATVIGSDIYVNMTSTQSHPDSWRDTAVSQTRINLATLSGTFYEVGRDYNASTRTWDNRYTAGTVKQAACP